MSSWVHFRQGEVMYHAMSKGEVAESSLTPKKKDGSMCPAKQGVPGEAVVGGYKRSGGLQNIVDIWSTLLK